MAQPEEQNELAGIPEPGDMVADKYRVDRRLGLGGMGCVVAATHLGLEQPVAIKFMLSKFARFAQHVTRFEREAKAAARLKSDHVTKVLDVGVLESGTPYMVMELLEGEDLAGRLRRGPLPIAECVDVLLEASEALAEAHRAGIVHRDIKPGNLFLARQSDGSTRVKVLDFGISKIMEGPGSDLTKTSTLMGSPLYMSPEQMMSAKATDARSDIWALGCIAFECLSGRPPFWGETLPELCSLILGHPPTKLRSVAPHVPLELEAAIERALAKRPDERYRDLAEMCEVLVPFAGPRGQRAADTIRRMFGWREPVSIPPTPIVPPMAPIVPAMAHASTAAPVAQTMSRPVAPTRHAVIYAAAAAIVLAAIVTLALVMPREQPLAAASAPERIAELAPAIDAVEDRKHVEPAPSTAPSASTSASTRAPNSKAPTRRPVVKPGDSLFNTP